MKRIGSLISPYVKSLGIESALKLDAMQREWSEIFGEPLCLHAWPVNLQNGELLIHVDSAVWLQQISFYNNDIVKKLSSFAVKEIRLRLGKVRSGKKTREPQLPVTKCVSVDSDTRKHIEETVSAINDSALRESIIKAMEKAFSRGTRNAV